MSERISQSNPEKDEPKTYLIPVEGQLVRGYVTGVREERTTSPQRNGPPLQLRKVEMQYEIIGADGEISIEKNMFTDYLLTDSVQEELIQRFQWHLQQQKNEGNHK
jgi:hypothetical protein